MYTLFMPKGYLLPKLQTKNLAELKMASLKTGP